MLVTTAFYVIKFTAYATHTNQQHNNTMKHDTVEKIVTILTQSIYIISMLFSAWFLWQLFIMMQELRAM